MIHSTNSRLWYNIYLLICPNFNPQVLREILNLTNKFDRLSIHPIVIDRTLPNFPLYKGSCSAALRVFLPDYLPEKERIIHLDADTITFKDLDYFYDLDMTNLSFRGNLDLDFFHDLTLANVTDNDHYINSGVILINLDELRKNNFIERACNYTRLYGPRIHVADQTIINSIEYKKCGLLPPEIGFHSTYCTEHLYKTYFRASYYFKHFTYEDIHSVIYNLTVVHFIVKPWERYTPYRDQWGLVALQTDYADFIMNKYPWTKNLKKY